MPIDLATEAPDDTSRLHRLLADFRTVGRMDVAFGGRVLPQGSAIAITGLHGTRTRALSGLRIRAGDGLGGKALVMSKPVSVAHYFTAQGITHHFDEPVRAEHLETVTALPIVVDRVPRMVIYVATRTQVALGDRWYDTFIPLVRRVERDIAVDDEVRRRLNGLARPVVPTAGAGAGATAPALSRADLRDIVAELADLASLIEDDTLRARVDQVRAKVDRGASLAPRRTVEELPTGAPAPLPKLAAREVEVLEKISLGLSNRQAAEQLGLLESTVKSYLKNAMRKLHASNRVHAVRLAREAGVIE